MILHAWNRLEFHLTLNHRLLTATAMCPEEILPQDITGDDAMLDLVASLRYIRVNYVHFSSEEQCMYETLSWNLKTLIKNIGSNCHKFLNKNHQS